MNTQTSGKIISASKQWWLKINRKPIRAHALDRAVFPYVVKFSYIVNGTEYTKRKWIHAGKPVPAVGSSVTVVYDDKKPTKAKILEQVNSFNN